MRAKFVNEYLAAERQEGQRFRQPGQVDYPLAEEDDDRIDVRAVTGDKGVVEVEEEIEEEANPMAMPSGNFVKKHLDYYKKEL